MHGSSGCLGCCTKPKLVNSVDQPPKERGVEGHTSKKPSLLEEPGVEGHTSKKPSSLEEPGVEGHTSKKPSLLEDFWTTSTCDMDNSAVQSQGSISSIGANNQNFDTHGGAGSTNGPEFVNHGLHLWNQTRQRWLGNKRSDNRAQQVREPKLNWNATYESLLGSNKPFPQPIPLSEMVDFLVDIWEQEGMYD